jgi:hypothetical protein
MKKKNFAVLCGVAGQPVSFGKVYDVIGMNVIIEDYSGHFGSREERKKSPPWDRKFADFFISEKEAKEYFDSCKRTEGG